MSEVIHDLRCAILHLERATELRIKENSTYRVKAEISACFEDLKDATQILQHELDIEIESELRTSEK